MPRERLRMRKRVLRRRNGSISAPPCNKGTSKNNTLQLFGQVCCESCVGDHKQADCIDALRCNETCLCKHCNRFMHCQLFVVRRIVLVAATQDCQSKHFRQAHTSTRDAHSIYNLKLLLLVSNSCLLIYSVFYPNLPLVIAVPETISEQHNAKFTMSLTCCCC